MIAFLVLIVALLVALSTVIARALVRREQGSAVQGREGTGKSLRLGDHGSRQADVGSTPTPASRERAESPREWVEASE